MKTIFDKQTQDQVLARLKRLTPQSSRRWGTMTAPQMVNHLNTAFDAYSGKLGMSFKGHTLWTRISKLLTFTPFPIPRGRVRIPKAYESQGEFDLNFELDRFEKLMAEFVAMQHSDDWPEHLFLGPLSAPEYGKLTYKHIDHHLKQFGV